MLRPFSQPCSRIAFTPLSLSCTYILQKRAPYSRLSVGTTLRNPIIFLAIPPNNCVRVAVFFSSRYHVCIYVSFLRAIYISPLHYTSPSGPAYATRAITCGVAGTRGRSLRKRGELARERRFESGIWGWTYGRSRDRCRHSQPSSHIQLSLIIPTIYNHVTNISHLSHL